MAQFTLSWGAGSLIPNTNCTGVNVYYRKKSVGGAWISTGFSPANPLNTSVITTDSPTLDDNYVYEFKVEAECTENGPTINDNGVQEAIGFACIAPTFVKDHESIEVTLDVTGLDITKARFTLRRSDNNNIVSAASIVNKTGNEIVKTYTGLTASTNYYVQVELYATVNAIEVISSDVNQLSTICSPYPVATEAAPVCDPITSLDVSSIEVL